MIKKNISEIKFCLVYQVYNYNMNNDSKVYSFENIINRLTNNFNSENYEYYTKCQGDEEIYSLGTNENTVMSAYNEILYINFRKQEDAIALKMRFSDMLLKPERV